MESEITPMKIQTKDQTAQIEELSKLILERDYLICQRSVQLRSEYMLKIGSKEHIVYGIKIELSAARRRLALIRTYTNRSERPDMKKIDSIIENEFTEYRENIKKQAEEIKDAIDFAVRSEPLSDEEHKELKETYYRIVRSVHPDVNPSADDNDKETYLRAVDAYKKGDLDCIRAIYWTLTKGKKVSEYVGGIEQKILKIRCDIEQIKKSFPFNKIDLLSDDDAVRRRTEELSVLEEQYTKELKYVNKVISELYA